MSISDLSTTAASNNAAAPTGAPEGSFLLGDVSNTFRELMAVVRSLAASDTIAAAATTDLGSKTYATFLTLTGTATTITGLGTVSAGIYKFVVYNAAHSVTHNATSLILQGGASRTVVNGDVSLFVSLGSGNWRELFYSGGAYQPLDATLTALAALNSTAGLVEQTGADAFTKTPITAFAKTLLDDVDAAAARDTLGVSALTPLDAYPVGAVYISVVSTSPATLFGGTWEAFGAGRVLVGIDATQTEFDTVEKTGGAKTHTLSAAEMPSHTHTVQVLGNGTITGGNYPNGDDPAGAASTTSAAGGGGAHNNLQPYIVCYFWKRTA